MAYARICKILLARGLGGAGRALAGEICRQMQLALVVFLMAARALGQGSPNAPAGQVSTLNGTLVFANAMPGATTAAKVQYALNTYAPPATIVITADLPGANGNFTGMTTTSNGFTLMDLRQGAVSYGFQAPGSTTIALGFTVGSSGAAVISLNQTCYADQQAGADAEAKIAACLPGGGGPGALPSTGGRIDATGLTGAQTWGATLSITKNVLILFGPATFTYSGSGDMITVPATARGVATLQGPGGLVDAPAGVVFINNSTTGHGISNRAAFGNAKLVLLDIRVDSAVTQANRISGNGVDSDFGDGLTSTELEIDRCQIFHHQFGIRQVLGIKSSINRTRANGWIDGIHIEGGTTYGLDSDYYNGAATYRDGFYFTNEYSLPTANIGLVQPWKASTVYPAGSFVVPFLNGGDAATHYYKTTAGGTAGATEPALSTSITGYAVSGSTFTLTVGAVPSVGYSGALATVSGMTGGVGNSPNGTWTVDSVTGTTITITQSSPGTGWTGGTIQLSGWCLTAACTLTDGSVTWTEQGTLPTLFGPLAVTIKNPASDSAGRYNYNFVGTSQVGVLFPDAEGNFTLTQALFHVRDGNAAILNPSINTSGGSNYMDGIRIVRPSGILTIGPMANGAQNNGYALNVVGTSGASGSVIAYSFETAGNQLTHDPQGQIPFSCGVTNSLGAFSGLPGSFIGCVMRANQYFGTQTYQSGIGADGGGFKHKRGVAGCATAASAGQPAPQRSRGRRRSPTQATPPRVWVTASLLASR